MYKTVQSCFTCKALSYTDNVMLINKNELTLTTWIYLINNNGPKKPYTKEYCRITSISNSKVNKTNYSLNVYISSG